MAELQNVKPKPLTKDNVVLLLDLISSHNIILTKATNAANNKLKLEAWQAVAEKFIALTGVARRAEQLRLKWENLKKAARKRSALIRQNNIKTGGGTAHIPPDETLDRVGFILGATSTGLPSEFGGDVVNASTIGSDATVASEPIEEVFELKPDPSNIMMLGDHSTVGENKISPKKFNFKPQNKGLNKQRKLFEEVQRAQRDKDQELANYFKKKTEKVEIEKQKPSLQQEILMLEKTKLKLEIKKLNLEIKKLKSEINED